MSELSGMVVPEVRRISEGLRTQARNVEASVRAIDRLVALAEQNWRGPDVAQFRDHWHNGLRTTAQQLSTDLTALGEVARKNADAQTTTSATLEGEGGAGASGAGGGATAGGGGGGGGAGSWGGETAPADHRTGLPSSVPGLPWIGDEASKALAWAKDKFQDAKQGLDDFAGPRIAAAMPALDRFAHANAAQAKIFTDLLHGDLPQFSELTASALLIGGTGAGTFANIIGGKDYKFLDPGTPGAGQPVATDHGPADQPKHPVVTDFTTFTQATMDVYDNQGIRVQQVTGTDGVQRYIVLVPGTESGGLGDINSWRENANAHNWGANLWAVAQGSSATDAQAVKMAMENAGIPPGSEVLFGAHSQGGIVVSNLAADPAFAATYNVQGVISYGSPVQCADFPAQGSPPRLSIQHGNTWQIVPTPLGTVVPIPIPTQIGDPVAMLDLNGAIALPMPTEHGLAFVPGPGLPNPNLTSVNLPPRGDAYFSPPNNHEQQGYIESLNAQHLSPEKAAAIDQYLTDNGLKDKFFTGAVTSDVRVQLTGK